MCPSLRKATIVVDDVANVKKEILLDLMISRWHLAKSQNASLKVEVKRVPEVRRGDAKDERRHTELERCISEGLIIYHRPAKRKNGLIRCAYRLYSRSIICSLIYLDMGRGFGSHTDTRWGLTSSSPQSISSNYFRHKDFTPPLFALVKSE